MPTNSSSAWMKTGGICRFAVGIWSNWYVDNIFNAFQVLMANITVRAEGLPSCCQPVLVIKWHLEERKA
jgi:hypothetical protein